MPAMAPGMSSLVWASSTFSASDSQTVRILPSVVLQDFQVVLPMMPHLHFSWSIAIPDLSSVSFISPSNRALQVILGVPLPLLPTTFKFLQALTQSSTSFRSTCPNHLNLLRLITFTTPSIQSLPLMFYREDHILQCDSTHPS